MNSDVMLIDPTATLDAPNERIAFLAGFSSQFCGTVEHSKVMTVDEFYTKSCVDWYKELMAVDFEESNPDFYFEIYSANLIGRG